MVKKRKKKKKSDGLTTYDQPDILHLIFLAMNRICLKVTFPLGVRSPRALPRQRDQFHLNFVTELVTYNNVLGWRDFPNRSATCGTDPGPSWGGCLFNDCGEAVTFSRCSPSNRNPLAATKQRMLNVMDVNFSPFRR